MSNVKITAEELKEKTMSTKIDIRKEANDFLDWLVDVMENNALHGYYKVSFNFAEVERDQKDCPTTYYFLRNLFRVKGEIKRGMVFDDLREAGYKVHMEYHSAFKDCVFEVSWE